jgi:osmotically-inducible protein OsmY
MFNDEVSVDEVREGLERDPRVPHPSEIAVSERSGTVILRGTVANPGQLRAAVQIAKAVPGVRDVQDELRVDPRDRFDDDEMRGAAIQALISDSEVPDDRIEVTVAEAWLTLKGEVEHQYESNAAFEAVSEIAGVGGITNQIRVIAPRIHG